MSFDGSLEVICVRRARRRLERRIGIFGTVSAIGPIVALVVLGPLIAAFDLESLGLGLLVALLVGWMVGVPSAAVLGSIAGRAARISGTRLRATKEGLEVSSDDGERRHFERARMTGGMLVRNRETVAAEIDLDDGSVLSIEAEVPNGARVLSALGLADLARREAFELGGSGAFSGCWALMAGAFTMCFGTCGLAAVDTEPIPAAYALGVMFVLPVLIAMWRRAPDRVVIGTDGVLLQRSWSRRFVPWSTVEEIAATDAKQAWIAVRRGRRVRRIVLGDEDERGAALAAGLRKAFEAWQMHDDATLHAALVERRGRAIAVWREEIERAYRSADYRAGFMSTDQLVRTAVEPDAPVSHRVGAALTLATMADEDAMNRVRIALDGVANEPVRVALDLALARSTDDAALEKALEDAEAAHSNTR